MSKLLHIKTAAKFYEKSYVNVIDFPHLEGTQVKLDKLELSDSGKELEESFWGYVFKKGERKYLLSAYDENMMEISLKKTLPIIPTTTRKVANKNVAYWQIIDKDKMAIEATKYMEFRDLLDTLSDFEHSHEEHYKLWWFILMSQLVSKANFRLSTPTAFGKTNAIDLLTSLGFKTAVAAKPNRPKLELLTRENMVWIDEINDTNKGAFDEIKAFIMSVTDDKPRVQKQTRAHGSVGEVLDVSDVSWGFIYNDIDHYPDINNYLDFRVNDALLDRFVPIRLNGKFTEDDEFIHYLDIDTYVEENIAEYVKLVRTIQYYRENYLDELKQYDISEEIKDLNSSLGLSKRQRGSCIQVLKLIDLYCSSQEEFDKWQQILINAIKDYKDMLEHMPIRKKFMDYMKRYRDSKNKDDRKKYKSAVENLNNTEPFKAKTALCLEIMRKPEDKGVEYAQTDSSWFEG